MQRVEDKLEEWFIRLLFFADEKTLAVRIRIEWLFKRIDLF